MVSDAPSVTLRAARAEDASEIAEIWYRGWQDGHLGFVPQELVDARTEASFRTRASERISDTTAATVDGAVVGFVMVVDDEVEQVYVAAAYASPTSAQGRESRPAARRTSQSPG